MGELVELSITNYLGSIGAEHYYGRLNVRDKAERVVNPDGSVSHVTHGGFGADSHPLDRTEVERVIDGKEAAYLNKKDGFGSIYRRGSKVNRFNDRQSVIDAATALFPTIFAADDLLVVEMKRHSGVYTALAGPAEIVEGLTARPDYLSQAKFLDAHGYLTKASGIEARSAETAQQAQPVRREPARTPKPLISKEYPMTNMGEIAADMSALDGGEK